MNLNKFQKPAVVFLSFVFVIAALTSVFAVGIYHFNWDGPVSRAFVKIVPLPVAVVNNDFIPMANYFDKLEAYKSLVSYQSGTEADAAELDLQKVGIINQLVEEAIVLHEARARSIAVTRMKADRYFRHLMFKFQIPEQEQENLIKSMFGMRMSAFRKLIVEPDLRRAELAVIVLRGDPLIKKAETIRDELIFGADFAAVAVRDSADETSKYIGGELGFVSFAALNPWLAEAVFDLEPGKASEVIVSPEGFHIVEVLEKDAAGQEGKVRARQILIETDSFDKFLEAIKQNYRVSVFN